MLTHHAVTIDQNQAWCAAHLVPLHGVRNGTGGIRLIKGNRKLQPILLNERLQYRAVEGIMMFKRRVHANYRDIAWRKGFVDSARLRPSGTERVRTQTLKCREYDDPASQPRQCEGMIGVEPLLNEQLRRRILGCHK